jgi:hypothetical protein
MFAAVVVQRVDNKLVVVFAEEYEHPEFDSMVYDAAARIKSWDIHTTQCDGAQPAYIRALKSKVGENTHYETIPKEHYRFMKVKPVAFGTEHREMLGNAVLLMEKGWIAIHPKFDKLITALQTAVGEDYSLDKEATLHHDILDAFRLALKPYGVGR